MKLYRRTLTRLVYSLDLPVTWLWAHDPNPLGRMVWNRLEMALRNYHKRHNTAWWQFLTAGANAAYEAGKKAQ